MGAELLAHAIKRMVHAAYGLAHAAAAVSWREEVFPVRLAVLTDMSKVVPDKGHRHAVSRHPAAPDIAHLGRVFSLVVAVRPIDIPWVHQDCLPVIKDGRSQVQVIAANS
jgi:hypothetical protein